MNLSISEKGLSFVKSWEHFEAKVYPDSVGLPTIGYGHKCLKGEIWPDEGIDEAWAVEILQHDLLDPSRAVNTLVRITILQPQFDALVSLCFNIGQGNFRTSTLLKKLNVLDVSGAADQFLVWCHAGGIEVAGLERRRKAEREIFLHGVYSNNA